MRDASWKGNERGQTREALRKELRCARTAELGALQGENPLMRVCVDGHIVGEVVSGWTGIPAGKMLKDEIATVLTLEAHLEARVIGQNHALEQIARAHPHVARQPGRSATSPSACFCWWVPAASARRRPR